MNQKCGMFVHLLFSVIIHHYSKSASTVIWCQKRPDLYFKGMRSVLVQMVLIMFSVIIHHTDVSRSLSTSESSCSYSTVQCRGRDPISPWKMKKAAHKMFKISIQYAFLHFIRAWEGWQKSCANFKMNTSEPQLYLHGQLTISFVYFVQQP